MKQFLCSGWHFSLFHTVEWSSDVSCVAGYLRLLRLPDPTPDTAARSTGVSQGKGEGDCLPEHELRDHPSALRLSQCLHQHWLLFSNSQGWLWEMKSSTVWFPGDLVPAVVLSEVCATQFMPWDHSSNVLKVLKISSHCLTPGSFDWSMFQALFGH